MGHGTLTWNAANKVLLATFVALLSVFTLISGIRANNVSFSSLFSIPRNAICGVPSTTHAVNFTQRDQFWDLTAAGDKAWASILPQNGGFVPHEDSNGHAYITGISMFHQLHCLQMIRMAIQKLENSTHEHDDRDVHDHHKGDQRHWVHCLDYLMQAITCAADDTIEPFRGKLVNGYGVVHQCRDSGRLWKWAQTPLHGVGH